VSFGNFYSPLLTSSGDIYGWGENKFGQIENGSDSEYQLIPFKMNCSITEKFKAISCGFFHSLALTEGGRVHSCGRNNFGQLGNGSFTDSDELKSVDIKNIIIVKISFGSNHSILLSKKERFIFSAYVIMKNQALTHVNLKN
jgi:alpha-tubulin suppressor-like RCC1 family protein